MAGCGQLFFFGTFFGDLFLRVLSYQGLFTDDEGEKEIIIAKVIIIIPLQ